MPYTFNTTIAVHPHAMGHVIGKNGSIIKRIRKECDVQIYNTPYSEHQTKPVSLTIEGKSRFAIHQALYQIDHQIAISSEWCKKNGVSYQV